jgi:hypothetical protein
MPGYQIMEWNEQNYNVHKIAYTDEAYKAKKWAFVSDYARFDILYHQGGIYFDTDVELLKSIPDEILEKDAFTGMESAGRVGPGLVFACCAGAEIAKRMLASYEKDFFDLSCMKTVNERLTDILLKDGFVPGMQEYQEVGDLAIYPAEIFCAYDQDVREINITDKSVSVHYYAGSWKEPTLKKRLRVALKRVLGVEGYRKVLYLYRKARLLKTENGDR